jgi:hypothetical protein
MPRYELFRLDALGPIWFGTAETMQDAHAKASQANCPECLVLDNVIGEKIVVKPRARLSSMVIRFTCSGYLKPYVSKLERVRATRLKSLFGKMKEGRNTIEETRERH